MKMLSNYIKLCLLMGGMLSPMYVFSTPTKKTEPAKKQKISGKPFAPKNPTHATVKHAAQALTAQEAMHKASGGHETQVLNKQVLQQTIKKLDLEIPIRVLLDEQSFQSNIEWKFRAEGGFVVFAPETKIKTVYQMKTIKVTCSQGSFSINGQKQRGDHLFIIPLNGPVLFKKNNYDGVLALTLYNNTAYVVNHLDLEDYVLSVLPYESFPEWPDEVHKAFCVAFRSYGIAKVLEQREIHAKSGNAVPYDIKDTNVHQIYKGRAYTARFKKIIDQTRGMVLAYNNKPILAMFDICCGGIIPAKKRGIHFAKAPYLKRTYPCTFCKPYKFHTWTCMYTYDQLERALKKEIPALGSFRDMKIAGFDDAGVVTEVRIRGNNQWYTLPASKFKGCLKDMRSLCFRIQKQGHTIKIIGKGHGHHMGLCQRGAYYMVLKKWRYRNILKFFYPHTTFMKLQKMKY